MPGLLNDVDPNGLLEYSVVYTDRAVNHMSTAFQGAMRDISRILKQVYHAHSAIIVPGSGTFGMEAIARQFATGKRCLILRNGLFSFRWTQIFETGRIPSESKVLMARRIDAGPQAPFAPAPIEEVVACIREMQPDLVFAPHVDTASGIILPRDYLRAVAEAVHDVGGLLVLDCVASGAIWVEMDDFGIDILISAPQKGWSGSPCCAMVMLGETARKLIEKTGSTSFACDLRKWLQIMETYEGGSHAYHATMPTDSLMRLRDVMLETERYGFDNVKIEQQELGDKAHSLLEARGFKNVAAKGFQAPGVIVNYTDDPEIQSGKKFRELGMQIAAGVPLQCEESPDYRSFRIGLFGLDKIHNVERSVASLSAALDRLK